MKSSHWLRHFQNNRLHRAEPAWETPAPAPDLAARLLARSLSHFQLGESGDGRCLLRHADLRYGDDPDYCAALALFIAEEQEHARLLARMLTRLGGAPIQRHWTHGLFRVIRQALGVNFELQVLVIAELAGTGYYRLLQRSTTDPVLRQLCDLVLADERHHVDFHADRFAQNHEPGCRSNQPSGRSYFRPSFSGRSPCFGSITERPCAASGAAAGSSCGQRAGSAFGFSLGCRRIAKWRSSQRRGWRVEAAARMLSANV